MTFDIILHPLIESLKITAIVFLMMIAIDLFNIKVKGKLNQITGGVGFRQYLITNFLGIIPGCFGSFMNVSLYMHGTVSFGALTGAMIATSGDEAFVMIAQLGWQAVLLFAIIFFLGMIGSYLSDFLVKKFKIAVCVNCKLQVYHKPLEHKKGHVLKDHIWNHIFKSHVLPIFAWTFGALLVVHIIEQFLDLEQMTKNYMIYILFISALIGLLPESGPHLIFVSLFAAGHIPFSILLTSSMVQEGHGLLPLMSFSIKDTVLIKLFKLIFGLITGLIIFSLGY